MDRIDLHVEMTEVGYSEIAAKSTGEPSSVIRARINAAREIQRARYKAQGFYFNAQLPNRLVKQYCEMDADSEALLRRAFVAMNLSARAYNRILKVARTIADIEGKEKLESRYVAEAVQYRSLDKK